MPYCSKCGVEVENGVASCPLCGTPIQDLENAASSENRYPDFKSDDKPRMSGRGRRNLAWETISILCAIAVIVVLGSDLQANARITWSVYPISSVAFVWVVSGLLLFLRKLPWLVVSASLIGGAALLATFAWESSGSFSWFVVLGLPLMVLAAAVVIVLIVVISHVRYVGLNVVAFVSIGVALLCAGSDGVIHRYVSGSIGLSWSVIVLQALLPFAAIMLFLHYRLRSQFDFRRLFHL